MADRKRRQGFARERCRRSGARSPANAKMPYMPERICETAAIDVERPDLSGRREGRGGDPTAIRCRNHAGVTYARVFRSIQMVQAGLTVMPGLVPGIHGSCKVVAHLVDGRDEPGHDDRGVSSVSRLSPSDHLPSSS